MKSTGSFKRILAALCTAAILMLSLIHISEPTRR